MTSAAQTLGVSAEQLSETVSGFPTNDTQAAQTLGLAETTLRTAVENRFAANLDAQAGGRPGRDQEGGGFNPAALATFVRILLHSCGSSWA